MNIKISDKKVHAVNPGMMGLFFEDINYAADGGLYAELIENRAFSFVKACGDRCDYYTKPAGDYAWSETDPEKGKYDIVSGSSLATDNPDYMRITALRPGYGIRNKAYEGISTKKDLEYNLLFWARPVNFEGSFNITISDTDKQTVAKAEVDAGAFCDETYNFWKMYRTKLTADSEKDGCTFEVTLSAPGTVEFAYISLMPADAVEGVFRKDLFELLRDMHPGFIRFPGGCIVEGNTLQNRYRYKDSLKQPWFRKTNWNRWAVHENNKDNDFVSRYAYYNQTMGLGFYEYFLLCEKIGARALPVLNVGFACQYQSLEMVSTDSEEFKEFLQDALDLIEFANGPKDSKWGKVRASMGHPESFDLKLMGIGNEQWQTEKADFFERYVLFEKAIHEVYPDIKLIGSAGPDITSERYTKAWEFYRQNKGIKNFAYALDEHYYVRPEYLFENNAFYDDYDRDIKVFAGEYAAHPEGKGGMNCPSANTLWGALSEAAFLTGVERNCDVVVLASYAPLFARVNYAQWSPDMIWFNARLAYGSPSYHVQKLYAANMGDHTLNSEGHKDSVRQGIYYNLSIDSKDKQVILKVVNSNEREEKLEFSFDGFSVEGIEGDVLTGPEKDSYNFIDAPDRVTTSHFESSSADAYVLPALSFAVIKFNYR